MSTIRAKDMGILDEIFEMEGGYVLDFSDRKFRDFFVEELDVDIDDVAYRGTGTSKAKRLRCYLKTVDDKSAAKTLKVLWEYRQSLRERRSDNQDSSALQVRYFQLIDKLEGNNGSNLPVSKAPITAFDLEKFQTFKDRLLELGRLEPHPRGYAFEKFLRDLFNAFALGAREPFRLVGEQIDGSFVMSGETYLIEAKWHNSQCGAAPLHTFHGKLEQKAVWARGVFISYAGFTPEGLHAFGRAKRVVCVDGLDLHEALRREITLPHLLESKVRRAAETGEPFTGVRNLFP